MEDDAMTETRIKVLRDEMDSIARADSSHWKLGSQADREARADHQRGDR
jgi:hypothetical protein